MVRHARAIMGVGICLLFCGCGDTTSVVRGKVVSQGKTVVWGTVTLLDARGNYHQARIDPNGQYELNGVAVGSVKIGVVSPNPEGRGATRGNAPARGKDAAGENAAGSRGAKAADPEVPLPPAGAWFAIDIKFADPAASGLTGEVKAGGTELNVDVK